MDFSSPRQVRISHCRLLSPGLEQRAKTSEHATELREYGIDLLPYMQRIEIFESIFDNTISGRLVLLEDIGLVEYVPIVGVEVVAIAFRVQDSNDKERVFSRAFRVTKVYDVSYPRHGFRLYTMDLATDEFVKSISARVCRRFDDVTCEQAVQTILVKDLNVNPQRIQTNEQTYGRLSVTIPNYTPLQAVNYFTMLAQTLKTPHESNFLFFETLTGFHFTSVRSLIEKGLALPLPKFNVDPGMITGAAKTPDEAVRNSLIRIHQEVSNDLLTDIAGGMLRSKMVHFDFLARKLAHVEDSRYTESFKKTTHLARYPLYPENFDLTVSKNTRIFTFPSNVWSSNSSYLNSIERLPVQNMWEAVTLRNRQLREIQHLQTLIDTPGHPELRAGNLIDMRYPSTLALQDETSTPISQPVVAEKTPYFSGPHLITSVRHILSRRATGEYEYRMHMRVCRDSLGSPLIGFANE